MPVSPHHEMYAAWWVGPLPTRPDFGAWYPWATVRAHACTRSFGRRVDQARRILDALGDLDGWVASLSAGKDSTALALLLPPGTRAFSVRDALCWPGEDWYLDQLARECSLRLERVEVEADLLEVARRTPGALTLPTEDRRGPLSGPWFRAADSVSGHRIWGIRAGENRGRLMNRIIRGHTYDRGDGVRICAPLADWSALDVHAYLASRGIPPNPVYLCVDPDADPFAMRHSWWVYGGPGFHHHYAWLRRWWPDLWDLAAEVDPTIPGAS